MKPLINQKLPGRVKGMLIDGICCFAIFITVNQLSFVLVDIFGEDIEQVRKNGSPYFIAGTALSLALIFNKDLFHGATIGKVIFGFRVITNVSGQPAGPLRCMVRNLFLLLWPIEFLMLLYSDEKRLGDFVAGTKVKVLNEYTIMSKADWIEALFTFVISFAILCLIFYAVDVWRR